MSDAMEDLIRNLNSSTSIYKSQYEYDYIGYLDPLTNKESKSRSYLNDAKSIKKKRPSWQSVSQKSKAFEMLKDEYNIEECLNCFESLTEKNIGDIYLSGSVALYLQGKITRTAFKDLDVICVREYMLDDDMYDNPYGCQYPPDPSGVERKSLVFNDIKIDLFSNIDSVNSVNVDYLGKTYPCQDYKDIIKAKLRMVLPKVKDLDELLETSFEITYK